MRLYETKKLHYGKYLYKLVVVNSCAAYFRTEFQPKGDFKHCRSRLDELHQLYKPGVLTLKVPWGSWGTGNRFHDTIPVEHFFDAIDIYRHLKKQTNYKIRVEQNCLHIYSNDRKMLVELGNKLRQRYTEFWEPNPENVELLNNSKNIIVVNKTPEFEYKITLGKLRGNPSLAKWIEKNPKLAKMGHVALEECYNNGWVKGYYFYVRDQKTLTIAQLLVGDNIQRVDKFVQVSS